MHAYTHRQRKFNGFKKSETAGRGAGGRRIWFVSFGTPPPGPNGGNTSSNTWQVLKTVHAAMTDKRYRDGGWPEALKVNASSKHISTLHLCTPINI